ncbi:hypothetical protein MYX07_06240 [Patescibacteria group bacterium AH-259-L07]|nr:hypothetical protein [Patescibacteria group bacterium AH-259-L07]
MRQQTKKCQNCSQDFKIESEDFDFYEKVKVPAPTFCPECRRRRRTVFRSEMSLYWRDCNLCGNKELSMFSRDKPYKVYCQKCWWSDKWNPLECGRDYDFNKPFFEQFKVLSLVVPQPSLMGDYLNLENSEYTNQVDHLKNCYLVFNSAYNENCYYCHSINRSKEVFDSMYLDKCELDYECFRCQQCYNSIRLSHCRNCIDSYFLRDCVNCQNCIGCFGLRSKQYHIFNQPYSKEEYWKKLGEFNLGSYRGFTDLYKQFVNFISQFPRRSLYQRLTNNITGNYIYESRYCQHCFSVIGVERGRYVELMETPPVKDVMDYTIWGDKAELIYECETCGDGVSNLFFCRNSWQARDMRYAWNCHNTAYIFGSIGFRNKQYCILNKQYSKEEYGKLVPKIIQHMNEMPYKDKKGRVYKYGEFFPPELSPFGYNETIAQEYFPLTKQQAREQGYAWKDPEKRDYEVTIKPEDLSDHIKDINDDILKQVIGCAHATQSQINADKDNTQINADNQRKSASDPRTSAPGCNEQCTTAFKIIPDELRFCKKMNFPLSRLCPNCRHYQRLKQRNPLKLWHRKCQCTGEKSDNDVYKNTIKHFHGAEHCPNEFETSYSPERKEIVYCEKCYQQEVV